MPRVQIGRPLASVWRTFAQRTYDSLLKLVRPQMWQRLGMTAAGDGAGGGFRQGMWEGAYR